MHQKVSLAGRLIDARNEQSMSGALVTLRNEFKRLSSRTLADGSFHFENLNDGKYTLFVSRISPSRKLEIALELTTFKEVSGYVKPFKTIAHKKELSISWFAGESLRVLDFEFEDNMVKILNNG